MCWSTCRLKSFVNLLSKVNSGRFSRQEPGQSEGDGILPPDSAPRVATFLTMPKKTSFALNLENVATSPAVTPREMRNGLRELGIDVSEHEASSMAVAASPQPMMRLAATAAAEVNKARISRDHVSVGATGILAVQTPGPGGGRGPGPAAHQIAEENKRHLLADHLHASDRGITADNTPKVRAGEVFINSAMRVLTRSRPPTFYGGKSGHRSSVLRPFCSRGSPGQEPRCSSERACSP